MKVSEARDQIAGRDATIKPSYEGVVCSYYHTVLKTYSIKRAVDPSAQLSLIADLENRVAVVKRAMGRFDFSVIAASVHRLVGSLDCAPEEGTPEYLAMMQAFCVAYIDAHEVALKKLKGEDEALERLRSYPVPASVDTATLAPPMHRLVTGTPDRTLADLRKAYWDDRVNAWAQSTADTYKYQLDLLEKITGDAPLSAFNRGRAREVLDTLKRLPAKYSRDKKLASQPISEVLDIAASQGLPTLTAKTINSKYMTCYKAMFGWAKLEEWMPSNPFEALSVDDQVSPSEKRDPFTMDQLNRIFRSGPWERAWDRSADRPSRFWIPLMCLFQGFRLGEAAGFRVDEIVTVEGVPCFDVKKNELRDLKTQGSRSITPIHPQLLALGFQSFLKEQLSRGEIYLFPDCETKRGKDVGKPVSSWFSQLLGNLSVTGRKLGIHAFRHNFQDALRSAELPEVTSKALSRRSEAGSSNAYGDGLSVEAKRRALCKVAYARLDLTHLSMSDPS